MGKRIGTLKALAYISGPAVDLVYPFGHYTPDRSDSSCPGSEPMADDHFKPHHIFHYHGFVLVVTRAAMEADRPSANFTNGFTL
jgi:hypothetical protein